MNQITPGKPVTLDDLEERLNHGDLLIRRLQAENKPIDAMVRHWLRLLREYEETYRAHGKAA